MTYYICEQIERSINRQYLSQIVVKMGKIYDIK